MVFALVSGLVTMAVPVSADNPQTTSGGGPRMVDRQFALTRLLDAAKTREERVALFQRALDAPEVKDRARAMGLDAGRVRAAIPHLSDKDLADLADRASRAKDVKAGHSSHGSDSGVIILGVALLIAAIVVVAVLADETGCGDYYYEDDCCCW